MAEPDEITQKIGAEVREKAKDQLARALILNWKKLHLIIKDLPEKPPTAAEFMGDPKATDPDQRDGLAGKLIAGKEVTIGGTKLSTQALITAVDTSTKDKTDAESIGLRETVRAIPTDKMLEEITEAAARGIKSQTSTGNKIFNFIAAVFTWIGSMIGSLFGQGEAISFSQALAVTAAPGVSDSVRTELQALANDPTKASSRLLTLRDEKGQTPVDMITDIMYRRTFTEMGGTPPPLSEGTKPPVPLNQLVPQDINPALIQTAISGHILNPKPDSSGTPAKPLATFIFETLKSARDEGNASSWRLINAVRAALVSDDKLRETSTRMANIIADTTAKSIADPTIRVNGQKLSELKPEEFSKYISEQVAKALKEAEEKPDPAKGKLDFGPRSSLSTKYGGTGPDKDKTYLEIIQAQVYEQSLKHYESIKPFLNVVATPTPAQEPRKPAPTQNAATLLATFDTSRDGKIDREEAEALTKAIKDVRVATIAKSILPGTGAVSAYMLDEKTMQILAVDNLLHEKLVNVENAKIEDVMKALQDMGVQIADPAARSTPAPSNPPPAAGKGTAR